MATWVGTNSLEDNRFKTISDFKQCMRRGGEVQFEWNGVLYCCFGCISPAADAAPKMVICQAGSVEVNTRTEKWCDTADEILEYMVGGDRLRDVITQVKGGSVQFKMKPFADCLQTIDITGFPQIL
ncbi:MAG: hypothetical protein EP146_16590 [Oscillibacter sp.]|uniref:hypothetical protein n=1 Tax=Oscillibacter sp. TaxID=1945593 RepID=UPI0013283563|nr:hypothetical protein [Oscillibacter sp.]MUU12849.1 hypothetical protein [Oscillibacter sp.]